MATHPCRGWRQFPQSEDCACAAHGATDNNSVVALARSFQDGGPPGLYLKLDGEASNSRRPGKPTKGSRYIVCRLSNLSMCVGVTVVKWMGVRGVVRNRSNKMDWRGERPLCCHWPVELWRKRCKHRLHGTRSPARPADFRGPEITPRTSSGRKF